MDELAKLIAEALAKVEQTHRTHGRAVAEMHKLLAEATRIHGAAIGLGDGVIALAAAPKNEPDNPVD